MLKYNELKKQALGSTIVKTVFGTQDFLAIIDGKKFTEQLISCIPYDQDKVALCLDQMTKGLKLHISIMSNLDRKKNINYFHVSIRSENGSRGYKLPDIEGISKLIDIYIEGKHKIDLNLEDVYNAVID
ncbi:hypothetical protein [Sphingobacterium deserti]|uniref:Uncharacterized protein n=1 Tax=Sphingobacterium deserti TaxID=1229276 RepID=A0A0B8T414_9SPHI|nr:hypothetical protein [Sphingobacterium deserti]KGE16071.1 hypothetical protein DI53_0186 [Sphingobacterium deserti]